MSTPTLQVWPGFCRSLFPLDLRWLHIHHDATSHWPGSENVQVDVTADGQLVLSKMLSPFGESCNADNLWKAEFYLGTSTEQVNLQVLAERAQSSQNPAAVALANVEMVPLTLGSLAWEERTSDFSQWSDGWALSKYVHSRPRARITVATQPISYTCWHPWHSRYGFTVCKQGVVLGGHNVLGTGGWVQKQFTDLPKHNALRIELTYVFFRTWDHEEGIILVDGVTRWSLSHQGGTNAVTDDCEGLQTRREGVTILVSGHVEDTVTIRATSTLEQGAADEAFGIRDVRVVPFTLSGGTGNGPWINDETVDFRDDASLKPWVGSHLDTTACSFMLVAASGSPDEDEAVVTAGYTQLPEHNAVEVKFKFVFLHPAGKMKGFVSIDSNAVWSEERASGDRDACPPTEAMYAEFSQIIQHSGSSLKIDAKAIRTEGTSEPSFAMYAVSVKPITLGVGKWQKGKSDFTTSTDGWFGPGLQQRTTCNAPISTTILGGDRTNKQVSVPKLVVCVLPFP